MQSKIKELKSDLSNSQTALSLRDLRLWQAEDSVQMIDDELVHIRAENTTLKQDMFALQLA